MKFIKLTNVNDNSAVWVNVNKICIIHKYYGRETTVIEFGGDSNYCEVLESVDKIIELINLALMM